MVSSQSSQFHSQTNQSPKLRWRILSACALILMTISLGLIKPGYLPSHSESRDLSASTTRLGNLDGKSKVAWRHVDDFDRPLAQFPTVFWEPLDTESLRQLIRETDLVRGKRILEIGTGTGLVALCCLQAGAERVLATDVNSTALTNARYNATALELEKRLETRLVPLREFGNAGSGIAVSGITGSGISLDQAQNRFESGAYAVVETGEQFDVIISNPPWEDSHPDKIDEYALYDENFELMQSLLDGLTDHLSPGGRCLLIYGCVTAIQELRKRAAAIGMESRILDDRNIEDLPEVFLPGMMIEIVVPERDHGKGGEHENEPPAK